jgi:mannose-6-phosphate isomerase
MPWLLFILQRLIKKAMESIKLYKLRGKVQHYAWGGFTFIPELLQVANLKHQPFAEYWMGAHPAAPSEIMMPGHPVTLNEFIEPHPEEYLGKKIFEQFEGLPYLFKILDVREMLSIQVHPTKASAEAGFEKENAAGIPLNAPHRNYKDANHKPEVMVALSEFWLLHGFLPENKLAHVLSHTPEFRFLESVFEHGGYYDLYKTVMEMEQSQVDKVLKPLVENAVNDYLEEKLLPAQPAYWTAKSALQDLNAIHIDRGVFSIYFFNIVRLVPGEAVFQGAGVPHAYLEGQNVELMANSDNVLRGGLTPKHIDVPELMQHVNFEATIPHIIRGKQSARRGEIIFPCPVDDFGISRIELQKGETYQHITTGTDILILLKGSVEAAGSQSIKLQKGESLIAFDDEAFTIRALDDSLLFRAFVPFT